MDDGRPAGPHALAPYLVLAIALLAVSHAAIFARLADAAPLAIAAWRLGIACLVVLPLAVTGTRGGGLLLRPMALATGAGAPIANNAWRTIVITRDAAGQVAGYVNGAPALGFADGSGGVALIEVDSAATLTRTTSPWTPWLRFVVTPIVPIEEATAIGAEGVAFRDSVD